MPIKQYESLRAKSILWNKSIPFVQRWNQVRLEWFADGSWKVPRTHCNLLAKTKLNGLVEKWEKSNITLLKMLQGSAKDFQNNKMEFLESVEEGLKRYVERVRALGDFELNGDPYFPMEELEGQEGDSNDKSYTEKFMDFLARSPRRG